jgi:dolichol-phosphate mannosyltransferase
VKAQREGAWVTIQTCTNSFQILSASSDFFKVHEPHCNVVSIVSPTYNEEENIELLIERVSEAMHGRDYEIIVVDDNSQDGTIEIAKDLSEKYPLTIVVREKKLGLASAILTGFEHAQGDILGVIDADLQHPPEYILEFVHAIEHDRCDIAIGSRYVTGGIIEGWSKKRLLASKLAILLAKPLVSKVKDPMSGFFFLKRSVIDGTEFNPTGYKLGLEILLKGHYHEVEEIPYTFRKRTNGSSKLNNREILLYLRLLRDLYAYKFSSWLFHG